MGAYKDKNGTWCASARYKNWAGETKSKMKRDFLQNGKHWHGNESLLLNMTETWK